MFNKLTIRLRLNAALLLLAVLLTAVGIIGAVGMQSADGDIKEIYGKELAAMSHVAKSQFNMTVVRTTLDRAMLHPDAPDVLATIDKAAGYRARSDDAWKAYLALPKTAEEKALADKVEGLRGAYFKEAIDPLFAALRARDAAAADTIVMVTMPPRNTALSGAMDVLERNQREQAEALYTAATARTARFTWLVVAAIGVGVLAALACAIGLQRAISVPLTRMLGNFEEIARGNLTESIRITSQDEMGALTRGLGRCSAG